MSSKKMLGDEDSPESDGPGLGPGAQMNQFGGGNPGSAGISGPPAPPGRQRKVELTPAQVAEKERQE